MALEDESGELDAVVARLVGKFPDADPGQIRADVQAQLARFDRATVRDFVPVLIENAVSDKLRETYDAQVRTAPAGPDDPPAGDGPLNPA
jgi:hypothetical protein